MWLGANRTDSSSLGVRGSYRAFPSVLCPVGNGKPGAPAAVAGSAPNFKKYADTALDDIFPE